MKLYGIETHWNGTQIFVVGRCRNKREAYLKALKDYRWFAVNPQINNIVIVNE